MSLKLIGIGTLGMMLSPAAKHLTGSEYQFIRVHDTKTPGKRRDEARSAWQAHGAQIVDDFHTLTKGDDYDGIVICAGKNQGDCHIIREILPLIKGQGIFVLHLSTVSANFVNSAHQVCAEQGIDYLNYPLTGGPLGAQQASMLILAAGSQLLFQRLLPMLELIGKPRYFGESPTAGTNAKLIGHCMVFNGLLGISSATALHSASADITIGDPEQAAFFDYLNQGAGGTRQWDVAMRKGLHDNVWEQGFMIKHAVVDCLYTAQLALTHQLGSIALLPLLTAARAMTYVLRHYPEHDYATHTIVREFNRQDSPEFDQFILEGLQLSDIPATLTRCVEDLPSQIKQSVMLDVSAKDFYSS